MRRRPVIHWVATAAVALTATFLAAGKAMASNMGFWLEKTVYVLGTAPLGYNLVALPARNPYQGSGGPARLCVALGLGPDAQIILYDGVGNIFSHICSFPSPQFNLLDGRGVLITDTAERIGLLVGADDPAKVITIYDLGTAPLGWNFFPVDYHTTFGTPQDLCVACGLSSTATVTRFDAKDGMIFTHPCGGVAQWSLVQGEAVLVLEDQGPKLCTPPHL